MSTHATRRPWRFLGFAVLVASVAVPTSGQAPGRAEGRSQPAPVIGVEVEVVQVDAVVTDKAGRYVTDLQPADFTITEDGRKQAITNFSYVDLEGPLPQRPALAPAPPPGALRPFRPEQVRRTMVFFLDDLSITFAEYAEVVRMLTTYFDQQMRPGDLAAIVRSDGRVLQQFTSDRRLLRAVVERSRFRARDRTLFESAAAAQTGGGAAAAAVAQTGLRLADFVTRQHGTIGSIDTLKILGACEGAVKSLRAMPGRKAIVFVSNGLYPFDRDRDATRVTDRKAELVDLAHRSSVVFYALDSGGLRTLGTPAGSHLRADEIDTTQTAALHADAEVTRWVMRDMARDTGGLMFADSNKLDDAMSRIVEDQRGYYLIGYSPDAAPRKGQASGAREHKVSVRVERPGLKVRSRRAFYSMTREDSSEQASLPAQFGEALASLFTRTDVRLRLTALFADGAARDGLIKVLVHIDARDLTFVDMPDGRRKASIETRVLLTDAAGKPLEASGRSDSLIVTPEMFAPVLRAGVVYTVELPARPGLLQVRAAVSDASSRRLGSASDVVEVPDLREGKLALSGIVMSAGDQDAQADEQATDTGGTLAVSADTDGTPAVRRFRPGARLAYALAVYNARVDPGSGQPDLAIQVSVYREDALVAGVPASTATVSRVADQRGLAAAGVVQLPAALEPGYYTLAIAASDRLARKKDATTVQWMSFEVASPAEETEARAGAEGAWRQASAAR